MCLFLAQLCLWNPKSYESCPGWTLPFKYLVVSASWIKNNCRLSGRPAPYTRARSEIVGSHPWEVKSRQNTNACNGVIWIFPPYVTFRQKRAWGKILLNPRCAPPGENLNIFYCFSFFGPRQALMWSLAMMFLGSRNPRTALNSEIGNLRRKAQTKKLRWQPAGDEPDNSKARFGTGGKGNTSIWFTLNKD